MSQVKFITIEGIEGTGKTTAIQFVADWFSKHQLPFIKTREPGGTVVAEEIRALFLKKQSESIHPDTELLLVFAARAQHLHHLVFPALQEGKSVICDRFTDASYAYQGGGRGLPSERIATLEEWVQQGFSPDTVILLDAPVELCLQRTMQRGALDRIELEKVDFFERARATYLQRAALNPSRYKVVDASVSVDKVQAQLEVIFSTLFSI
ncbi:MAG: dTMP kinase [Legionellales bacterium]|nr:dTMP kinase [Legionellales bacterium]